MKTSVAAILLLLIVVGLLLLGLDAWDRECETQERKNARYARWMEAK